MNILLQAVIGVSIAVLLYLMVVTATALYRHLKYKHEFIACYEALMSGDEDRIKLVNATTVYFWVRRSGYLTADNGQLKWHDTSTIATYRRSLIDSLG